ncbi:putative abhydrolase domain-containing protein [Forsythia ovata]|uniref:Abhydrolase domain-containing protein n=1 Tax=Forsythia ovata TaxID=205694 RepID=A0ABD1T7R9_9LAMI
MDKLKADLQNAESNVGEFSKRYDHATRAQEESNAQKKGLVDKVAELKNSLDSLKAENSSLKDENLKLEKSTDEEVKAGIENFINQFEFTQDYENLQAFFVNFGARQVLSELMELHPNLDLSHIEADYPA